LSLFLTTLTPPPHLQLPVRSDICPPPLLRKALHLPGVHSLAYYKLMIHFNFSDKCVAHIVKEKAKRGGRGLWPTYGFVAEGTAHRQRNEEKRAPFGEPGGRRRSGGGRWGGSAVHPAPPAGARSNPGGSKCCGQWGRPADPPHPTAPADIPGSLLDPRFGKRSLSDRTYRHPGKTDGSKVWGREASPLSRYLHNWSLRRVQPIYTCFALP